jgi:hypothetical protein
MAIRSAGRSGGKIAFGTMNSSAAVHPDEGAAKSGCHRHRLTAGQRNTRHAHAKQFNRHRRQLRILHSRLGRIIRDIRRKIDGRPTCFRSKESLNS